MIVHRKLNDGVEIDATRTMYPSKLTVVGRRGVKVSDETAHTFGYIVTGTASIMTSKGDGILREGGWFSIPGAFSLDVQEGFTVLVTRYGYRGLLQFGVIEEVGRLSYIDGCSDTLLYCPPRLGDPCFNYLHFPKGINQTQHTHPSIRFGVVARGEGIAYQRKDATHDGWEEPLTQGCVFLLHAQELHSFRTTESRQIMDVIAFHPDSDWGPTDTAHPMLNRTYIGNAKSALVNSVNAG